MVTCVLGVISIQVLDTHQLSVQKVIIAEHNEQKESVKRVQHFLPSLSSKTNFMMYKRLWNCLAIYLHCILKQDGDKLVFIT